MHTNGNSKYSQYVGDHFPPWFIESVKLKPLINGTHNLQNIESNGLTIISHKFPCFTW